MDAIRILPQINLSTILAQSDPEVILHVEFDDRWEYIRTKKISVNCDNGLALTLSKTTVRAEIRKHYRFDEETAKKLTIKYFIPPNEVNGANIN